MDLFGGSDLSHPRDPLGQYSLDTSGQGLHRQRTTHTSSDQLYGDRVTDYLPEHQVTAIDMQGWSDQLQGLFQYPQIDLGILDQRSSCFLN